MTESLQHILTDSLRKDKMVAFLKKNPNLFDETIKISLGNTKPQAWRAAWLIKHYMNLNDKRVVPHINSILKVISKKMDGHQREFLKIIMEMELTGKQEGIFFDRCITIWEDINKSSSVRGTALLVLIEIAKKYPELITEIEFLTQGHYIETLTPGIRNSVVRIINESKIEI